MWHEHTNIDLGRTDPYRKNSAEEVGNVGNSKELAVKSEDDIGRKPNQCLHANINVNEDSVQFLEDGCDDADINVGFGTDKAS
jgi:hypothetical protein